MENREKIIFICLLFSLFNCSSRDPKPINNVYSDSIAFINSKEYKNNTFFYDTRIYLYKRFGDKRFNHFKNNDSYFKYRDELNKNYPFLYNNYNYDFKHYDTFEETNLLFYDFFYYNEDSLLKVEYEFTDIPKTFNNKEVMKFIKNGHFFTFIKVIPNDNGQEE